MNTDRLTRGWTLSELAREIGQTPSNVARFFRGESCSPKTARQIAFALGHPLERYVRDAGRERVA